MTAADGYVSICELMSRNRCELIIPFRYGNIDGYAGYGEWLVVWNIEEELAVTDIE
ncbi:hypothetical protein DPMN_008346, partial [Dreissena polymorpha]